MLLVGPSFKKRRSNFLLRATIQLTQRRYLIADYERKNFSLSQCVYNEGAKEDIIPIHSLNYIAPANSSSGAGGTGSSSSSSSSSISTGAIAAIAIAVVLILLVGLYLAFAYRKRKWPFHQRKPDGTAELDSEAVGYEADGTQLRKYGNAHEIGTDSKYNHNNVELPGAHVGTKNELPGAPILGRKGSELQGSDAATEMPGSGVYMELAGSPVPPDYYGKPLPPNNTSRASSRATTATGSPRQEAARRGSGVGVKSPLSMRKDSSVVSPSPISAGSESREPSRMGRTGSERSAGDAFLMSPISPGSDSREVSASRNRGFDRIIGERGVSPMRLGGAAVGANGSEDVSREPSRTREEEGRGFLGRRS